MNWYKRYRKKKKELEERVLRVEIVKAAYEIGNSMDKEYNRGVMDGLELAIALYRDKMPQLSVSIKKTGKRTPVSSR